MSSTLTDKKRKINIQTCRTFQKLGFVQYPILSGNSSTYFKPFASAVKFSWMPLSGGRLEGEGGGGWGGGGEERERESERERERERERGGGKQKG